MKLFRFSRFVIFASVCALGFCGYVQPACAASKKAAAVAKSPTGVALLFPPMANDATAKQKKSRAAILRKLQAIQGGADINATDDKGQTALMCAAALNERLAACWLVAKGADVTLKSAAGKTALDYATEDEMRYLLVECMHEKEPALGVDLARHGTRSGMLINDISVIAETIKQNKTVGAYDYYVLEYPEGVAYLVRQGQKLQFAFNRGIREDCALLAHVLKAMTDDVNMKLYLALLANDIPTIKKLTAKNKGNLSLTEPRYNEPLLCIAKSAEAVRALAAAGAFDKKYKFGDYMKEASPGEHPEFLYYAIMRGASAEAIKALLDNGVKITDFTQLIDRSVDYSNPQRSVDILRVLFSKKKCPANVFNIGWAPASTDKEIEGHNKIIRFLISQGAVLGHTSLIDEETGKDIQDFGPWPKTWEPFRVGRYDVDIAKRILASGFDPKQKDEQKSTIFSCWPSADVAELLIAAGADVKAMEDGQTPLHAIAAGNGSPECVEVLIKHGADVNAAGWGGATPLHLARSAEVAEILLKHGANANAKDAGGGTPLNRAGASPMDDIALIETLVKGGADINYQDSKGFTLLMRLSKFYSNGHSRSAMRKKADAIDALLRMGAKADLRNADGKTALDLAKEHSHPHMIRVFNAHGVKE